MPEVGDPPAARAGNLRDEAAQVQPFDEAGDLRAAPAIGGSGGPEQLRAHLAVTEALERVLPLEHGGEQGEVGRDRRVEGTGRAIVVIPHRLHQAVEGAMGGGRIVDDGQAIEVAVIGRSGHGGV